MFEIPRIPKVLAKEIEYLSFGWLSGEYTVYNNVYHYKYILCKYILCKYIICKYIYIYIVYVYITLVVNPPFPPVYGLYIDHLASPMNMAQAKKNN